MTEKIVNKKDFEKHLKNFNEVVISNDEELTIHNAPLNFHEKYFCGDTLIGRKSEYLTANGKLLCMYTIINESGIV